MKKYLVGVLVLLVLIASTLGGAIADRLFGIKPLDALFPRNSQIATKERVVTEESVVTEVAEKVSDSVVTVSIQTPERRVLDFSPFGGFSSRIEGGTPEDIGTGFIVDSSGLVVTNKHVVSQEAEYKVITKSGDEYPVRQISRDPSNDIAILKIEANGLKPVELGDSSNLKVGQFVVAIGTALGEFRHTVTTGVISGLGRGITAGSVYEGYVERLDNVIQTDAAINPGNSGGPLLNFQGQVIGVNVAVAQGAQNIGFAIPINAVKEGLNQFRQNGTFAPRPFLGVSYQMISQQAALANEVPQGAFVLEVIADSAADEAGIQTDDILTKFDGRELKADNALAEAIAQKKVGDRVEIELWRSSETLKVIVTLKSSDE